VGQGSSSVPRCRAQFRAQSCPRRPSMAARTAASKGRSPSCPATARSRSPSTARVSTIRQPERPATAGTMAERRPHVQQPPLTCRASKKAPVRRVRLCSRRC
jgi:hypothetical protein